MNAPPGAERLLEILGPATRAATTVALRWADAERQAESVS